MASAEFTILLPAELAELVERKLRSGAYASASDVVADGLQALQANDAAMER